MNLYSINYKRNKSSIRDLSRRVPKSARAQDSHEIKCLIQNCLPEMYVVEIYEKNEFMINGRLVYNDRIIIKKVGEDDLPMTDAERYGTLKELIEATGGESKWHVKELRLLKSIVTQKQVDLCL